MATANELYQDAVIRRALEVEGLGRDRADEVIRMLEDVEADVEEQIRRRLERMGSAGSVASRSRQLDALLSAVRDIRQQAVSRAFDQLEMDLADLAISEAPDTAAAMRRAVGIEMSIALPSAAVLSKIATSRPLLGRLMQDWAEDLANSDAARIESAVRRGVLEGSTTDEIVRSVRGTRALKYTDGILRGATTRDAEAIVLTAVKTVTEAARDAVWAANSDIILGLRWVSVLDGRTTPVCRARDGKVAPVEGHADDLPEGLPRLEPSGARPPAHWRCFPGDCLVTPGSKIAAAHKRFYEGNVVVFKTAGGHEVTCTPNHPILTSKGWRAAELLEVGGDVVRYTGTKNPSTQVEAVEQHSPSRFEDVARAFFESRGVVTSEVITSAEDFHGDATDGEVCIVGTNGGLLSIERKLSLFEKVSKHALEVGLQLFGDFKRGRYFKSLFWRGLSAARSFMSRLHHGCALSRSALTPDFEIGLGRFFSFAGALPSHRRGRFSVHVDSALSQNPMENDETEVSAFDEVSRTLAGNVACDEIVSVGRRDFSGHVYNLQTETGFYYVSAGHIIAHNCRSIMVAIFDASGLIGERPFVVDTRTRAAREVDFRKDAKAAAGADQWKIMSTKEKAAAMRAQRAKWANERVGTVPAETTYTQFLSRQSAKFQDQVLGGIRGALFRRGGVSLDDLVGPGGRQLPLSALRAKMPQAFERAGV